MYNLKQKIMQKKNLFVGALLVCLLTMFTGCKEIMGSFDNPVSSYLKLKKDSVIVPRGTTLKIDQNYYSTISPATPTFTSEDEAIATIDPNGLITGVSVGTTNIIISLPKTDDYEAASVKMKVVVQGLIKMSPISAVIAYGGTYEIGATTVSDGVMTYKSSNEEVATVDEKGKITAVACGDASITVTLPATASFKAETAIFTAKVRITDADNFKKAFDAGVTNFVLADDAAIKLGATDFSGKEITITGNAEKPATITPTGSITINSNFKLSNVKVDASGLDKNFITLPSTAPSATNTIDYVTFENVNVKVKMAMFYSAAKGNLITDFNIINSIVQQTADATTIDFTKGSSAVNINIDKSTLYAPTTTKKATYSSQGGQKLTELLSDGTQTFKFTNSTFYNLVKGANFFTHRQSNQKWLAYDVQGCIFVDCGKSGQVVKGLNGGQSGKNPTWIIKGNAFNFGGADTSASESTGDSDEPVTESIAVVVKFADAAKGDFTQSDAKAGDPRWIK